MIKTNQLLMVLVVLFMGCAMRLSAHGPRKLVDMLIFSFDRPLQLYALLESVEKYVTGVGEIEVVYRTSDEEFDKAYAVVAGRFSHARYTKQGPKPFADFKALTMAALKGFQHEYVMFALDDMVFTDYVDVCICTQALQQYEAYGFYLRLGMQLNWSYSGDCSQAAPVHTKLPNSICSWCFKDNIHDWSWPNVLEMAIYSRQDILGDVKNTPFKAPCGFAKRWDFLFSMPRGTSTGLCFERSKVVSLRLNCVQDEIKKTSIPTLSKYELLELFNDGLKMALEPLFGWVNVATSCTYEPLLVVRQHEENRE